VPAFQGVFGFLIQFFPLFVPTGFVFQGPGFQKSFEGVFDLAVTGEEGSQQYPDQNGNQQKHRHWKGESGVLGQVDFNISRIQKGEIYGQESEKDERNDQS
jgi:hypothetical protein